MKKNMLYQLLVCLIFLGIVMIYMSDDTIYLGNKKISGKEDMLSMYLETSEDSKEYELNEDSVFPTRGYILNKEKSRCENGGELSWDKATGKARLATNSNEKCSIYFDHYIYEYGPVFRSDEADRYMVVWDDAGYENDRPVNVTIDLIKNGKVIDTMVLSGGNNWAGTLDNLETDVDYQIRLHVPDNQSYYANGELQKTTLLFWLTHYKEDEGDEVPEPIVLDSPM